MRDYIDKIMNLNSLDYYMKEYKYITGRRLSKNLSEVENKSLDFIKQFYEVRHLLIHGSAIKYVLISESGGYSRNVDVNDSKYVNLISAIKEKVDIDIPTKLFSIEYILMNNNIIDTFIKAILLLSEKFSSQSKAKFIDENIFKI